jgi:hypothetical protein
MSYVQNPQTGRIVKKNGRVHRTLLRGALVDAEGTSDYVESTSDVVESTSNTKINDTKVESTSGSTTDVQTDSLAWLRAYNKYEEEEEEGEQDGDVEMAYF